MVWGSRVVCGCDIQSDGCDGSELALALVRGHAAYCRAYAGMAGVGVLSR